MSVSDFIPRTPSAGAHAASAVDEEEERLLFAEQDPIALFARWFKLACDQEPRDPHAVALATADSDGAPDVRIVLMRDFDARGLVFYTNADSAKGAQMAANPQAAGCLYWRSILRQVRVRGAVAAISEAEDDAYFARRARGSQISAWASDQSRPMARPEEFDERLAQAEARFADRVVERPPFWRGYRLTLEAIEFWAERPFRRHARRVFTRAGAAGGWETRRLYP
ncbi:MAG: pyridoxamine 5'-phosphate oxidase [Caulobacterales bacterium]|nr:pyridoxamine 5'-phosphate oxidase [Caulobacterales bacterium]